MADLYRSPWGLLLLASLFILSACASLTGTGHTEDTRMADLQRQVRDAQINSTSTKKAMEEVQARLGALDAKLNFLEAKVQELEDRPQPLLITPTSVAPVGTGSGDEPQKPVSTTQPPPVTGEGEKPEPIQRKRAAVTAKRSPERDYDKAYEAYVARRYDEALALFRSFIERHPQHHLVDNAHYWVGEIYYDMENYPSAILAFQEVVTKYGEENKAPDALLKIGYAYIALDDPENARIFLKRVIKNYPFSDAEAKAREKLKELENL